MTDPNPDQKSGEPPASGLGESLRREAARTRPQFSEALHERVMASVRETPHTALRPGRVDIHPFYSWKFWAAALVLATVSGFALFWYLASDNQEHQELVVVPHPDETQQIANENAKVPDLNRLAALLITAKRKDPLGALNDAIKAGPSALHARLVRLLPVPGAERTVASKPAEPQVIKHRNRKPLSVEVKPSAPYFEVKLGLID